MSANVDLYRVVNTKAKDIATNRGSISSLVTLCSAVSLRIDMHEAPTTYYTGR